MAAPACAQLQRSGSGAGPCSRRRMRLLSGRTVQVAAPRSWSEAAVSSSSRGPSTQRTRRSARRAERPGSAEPRSHRHAVGSRQVGGRRTQLVNLGGGFDVPGQVRDHALPICASRISARSSNLSCCQVSNERTDSPALFAGELPEHHAILGVGSDCQGLGHGTSLCFTLVPRVSIAHADDGRRLHPGDQERSAA